MADTRRELSALQTILADNTSGDISAQDARDCEVSDHPSKQHQTSAFASPPSDPVTGDVWMPSDGVSVYRYSGSAWVPWGPIFPFTEPTLQTFAWINQGSSTISSTNGGIYLAMPSTAGANLAIRKKAKSPPYTITAFFLPNMPLGGGAGVFPACGLCFRQSSDGKVHTWGVFVNAATPSLGLASSKYTNATTFSADYTSAAPTPCSLSGVWLRIADDNTNRICSISSDGQNWRAFHTVGRTDFLTADEVGFFAGSVAGTSASSMNLLSWAEA